MKALVWEGVNEVAVQDVPDRRLRNRQDAILKVNLSSVCGSDLHQLSGYIPMLLERMARGELKTAHLATHPMPLDDGPRGYDLFKNKNDGCVRAVFRPSA